MPPPSGSADPAGQDAAQADLPPTRRSCRRWQVGPRVRSRAGAYRRSTDGERKEAQRINRRRARSRPAATPGSACCCAVRQMRTFGHSATIQNPMFHGVDRYPWHLSPLEYRIGVDAVLEMRRLQLLHELRSRGTIAAVARALSLTPSGVSQQLTVLQREVGVQLIERVGRNIRLTSAGERLADHAGALLIRLEQAENDLFSHTEHIAGTFRIGAFSGAIARLVAPCLPTLTTCHPSTLAGTG